MSRLSRVMTPDSYGKAGVFKKILDMTSPAKIG